MDATMEFGTPNERAQKKLQEAQQASNCTTLTSAKTSLTNSAQQPQSFAFKAMIEQQMKSINEQMKKLGC
ncbi:hypothetical protein CJ026_009125 [Ralstonia pickettii]|nr:hypothetical protein CJ026_009125 [Ralstonia pickettii]